jgi:tetratricopeptide (TPR) repeat protein
MSTYAASRVRVLILSMVILPAFVGLRPLTAEDEKITRALSCMDIMLYDEAISLFEQALQKHPMERGLRIKQAYACFRLNKYEEAAGVLNREHELFPADLKPLILLSLVQHAMGQADNAVTTARAVQADLDEILKRSGRKKVEAALRDLSPNAGLPAYILGLDASRKRDARTARSWLLRAQALGYDPTDCWLQAINAEMESGNWEEALKLCERWGESFSAGPRRAGSSVPEDGTRVASEISADALVLKAISLAQVGRRDECRASLEEALAAEPFRSDILMDSAIHDLQRAEFEKAARTLTKVIKLAPQDFQARYLLEQAHARRRLADGSTTATFSRDFLKARGPRFIYVLEGRPEDAVSVAQTYAVDFIERGLLTDAARHLRMFTEIYERSPSIYYNLGQLDNNQGLLAEALACGMKALRLKPDYRDAYDLMGNVYFKVGDFENAARSYESAVQLDTLDPLGFFNLACAFHGQGDDANAEKNWLEALRLEKVAPAARAPTMAAAGALDHSLTVKVEPVSAPCCEYLGLLYVRQGKTSQAIEYFEKAIAFNREGLAPYLEIGKLYRARNDLDKAREYFKKYLALGGDESEIKEP